jgi:hypothetical protein
MTAFNATVNKIELNKNRPEQILVGRPEISFDKDGNPIYPTDNDNGASTEKYSRTNIITVSRITECSFCKNGKQSWR